MHLNNSIPLLFGTPNSRSSFSALIVSFVVLAIGTCFYLASELWQSFPYFELVTLLLGLHGFTAVLTSGANLLFLFRYLLVWLLIFSTAFIWVIYDGEIKLAPFGVEYQTYENTRILVFAGLLSLCGSLSGWHVASFSSRRFRLTEFVLTERHRKRLLMFGLFLAMGFGLLFLYRVGGVVGAGVSYLENARDPGFVFGVFNIFHFFGISLLILAGVMEDRVHPLLLWVCVATLLLGVAAGSRADYLPQAFLIFMLFFNKNIKYMLYRRSYLKIFLWLFLGAALLLAGYASAVFLAVWRTGVDLDLIVRQVLGSDSRLFVNEIYGHKMLYLETGNMMLGGLYAAIVNVRESVEGFLLGESYLNYILTAPPAFLGLPRPLGLEWSASISGVTMSQGGIFEVAEAYWNFGLLGCFVASFVLSWLFAWLLQKGLRTSNYFFLTWYIVFGFMSFRAVWYQNFTYFRIMTIMLIIYLVAIILFRWFIAGNRRVQLGTWSAGQL